MLTKIQPNISRLFNEPTKNRCAISFDDTILLTFNDRVKCDFHFLITKFKKIKKICTL